MATNTNNIASLTFLICVSAWIGLGLWGYFTHISDYDDTGSPALNIHISPVIFGLLRLLIGIFQSSIGPRAQDNLSLIWRLLGLGAIFYGMMNGFGGDSYAWHYLLLGALALLDASQWKGTVLRG